MAPLLIQPTERLPVFMKCQGYYKAKAFALKSFIGALRKLVGQQQNADTVIIYTTVFPGTVMVWQVPRLSENRKNA